MQLPAKLPLATARLGIALCLVLALVTPAWAGDLDDVQQRGTLRHLGIPYANFVTGTGDGLDVELMQGFAKELGVKYEYVRGDWGSVFGDLTGRKIKPNGAGIEYLSDTPVKGDVAANGITVLPWREKAVAFSSPTFPNQVWLVARADSPTAPITPTRDTATDIEAVKKLIAGHSIIGKAGTCLDPSLYKLEAITSKIKLFDGSLNEIAPALLNGEAELTLLDVPDALVALQKWPGQIKIIGPVSGEQSMAVAFSRDSPRLLAAFDRYLDKCRKDGTYVALVKKYYPFVFSCFPQFFAKH
jgi:ABC-type amino acid transport substrate-binding protein